MALASRVGALVLGRSALARRWWRRKGTGSRCGMWMWMWTMSMVTPPRLHVREGHDGREESGECPKAHFGR
jgi:hypothetical protein